MGRVREFGIGIESPTAPDYVAYVKLAESLGFGACWVPEDLYRGAFTLASAIACNTSSIRIGFGILNPYLRHPAAIAMELGALEELSGGRSILGIGAGLRMWIEGQLGIAYAKPARAMRETIEIVRALFKGGDVTYRGGVFKISNLNLHFRPPRVTVPVYMGVLGPRNLEMAGRIADGVILSIMTSVSYARFAIERVRAGAAAAGRSIDDIAICANLIVAVSDDERRARDSVRPYIAMLLSFMADQADHPMFSRAGFDPEEIRRFGMAAARGESPLGLVTDRFVDAFAIAGSPERCRDALGELIDAGVTCPIAFEVPGTSPDTTIRAVARHLMPHFL